MEYRLVNYLCPQQSLSTSITIRQSPHPPNLNTLQKMTSTKPLNNEPPNSGIPTDLLLQPTHSNVMSSAAKQVDSPALFRGLKTGSLEGVLQFIRQYPDRKAHHLVGFNARKYPKSQLLLYPYFEVSEGHVLILLPENEHIDELAPEAPIRNLWKEFEAMERACGLVCDCCFTDIGLAIQLVNSLAEIFPYTKGPNDITKEEGDQETNCDQYICTPAGFFAYDKSFDDRTTWLDVPKKCKPRLPTYFPLLLTHIVVEFIHEVASASRSTAHSLARSSNVTKY
jgi:hypothetical protein